MKPGPLFRNVFFLIIFLPASGSSSPVVVNGSAHLACNKSCDGEIRCVYAHMRSETLVTECKHGSCVEGDAFKNRTFPEFVNGTFHLKLNPVVYNDDAKYMIKCNGFLLCQKKLDVRAPSTKSATVGETVTLPFYARTNKNIADHQIMYRCGKNGEPVVEVQQGKLSYGAGFERRVSVSLNGYRTGVLSLTIRSVQPSDEGTYYCTHGNEEPVEPEAWTLRVDMSTTRPPKDPKLFLPASGSSSPVVVNGSAHLACNKSCDGEIRCVYARMRSEILVTECKNGSCVEGDAFKNRTFPEFVNGTFHLKLNPVVYNDDAKYMITCNGSLLCQKKLDVRAPILWSATVGETVTLQFYAHTDKNIADHQIMYRCEKNGEPVVEVQQGKPSYGAGFERVSVSLNGYGTGDLSLTIRSVQPSDEGTYYCTHGNEEPVKPEAWTLRVDMSTTRPPKDPKQFESVKQSTFPWWGILLIVVAILCAICCAGFLCKRFNPTNAHQENQQNGTAGYQGPSEINVNGAVWVAPNGNDTSFMKR